MSVESTKAFLAGDLTSVPRVLQAPLISLAVTGTPTLIIADSRRVVRHVYVGQLGRQQQEEVLALIRPVSHSR